MTVIKTRNSNKSIYNINKYNDNLKTATRFTEPLILSPMMPVNLWFYFKLTHLFVHFPINIDFDSSTNHTLTRTYYEQCNN